MAQTRTTAMKDSTSTDAILLTREQVCARLNISKSHFHNEVDALRLRITYCGSASRVHIDDLNDYIGRIRSGDYAPAYSETDPWVVRYRSKSARRKAAAAKRAPRKKATRVKHPTAEGSTSSGAL